MDALKAELDARIARWNRDHLFEVYCSYRRHQNTEPFLKHCSFQNTPHGWMREP